MNVNVKRRDDNRIQVQDIGTSGGTRVSARVVGQNSSFVGFPQLISSEHDGSETSDSMFLKYPESDVMNAC